MILIGIFLFNQVEVLDFAGPFEVFSVASRISLREGLKAPFEVFTFSYEEDKIEARGGLTVLPTYKISHIPSPHIIIIPGGCTQALKNSSKILPFLRSCSQNSSVEVIASVCTGAFLLAQAGLLTGLKATTHWEDIQALKAYKDINVIPHQSFIDQGKILTSGGISSGIDMSLYLVERFMSKELALRTAHQMEYTMRN